MGRFLSAILAFKLGLLAGLGLGYAVAVLLAPAEGAESRARLGEEARELTERPRELAAEVQERVHHAVDEGRRVAAEKRAQLEGDAGWHPIPGEAADETTAI